MNTKSKRLIAAAFTVGALAGSLAITSPAQAHSSCAYLSNNRGYGCVSDGHHWGYVHDSRADNWGVRIHLWNNFGEKYVVGDGNGSASGDGGRHTGANEYYTHYQVCAGEGGVDTSCTTRRAA